MGIKHRALAITIFHVKNQVQERYINIGGKWLYVEKDMGRPVEGYRFNKLTASNNNQRQLQSSCVQCVKRELESWAGRKINWKKETYIYEWENNAS